MKQPVIALKVDVDTYAGTRDGVPHLLEIFDRFGIKATFYFSMGPDNSGKTIRRIFKKGFLAKQFRTGAPSAYGLKTLLYGTLLPAPMIAASFPDILRRAEQQGHETGIHCWDHVEWHDHLPVMPKKTAAMELGRASDLFKEIFGHPAATTAVPGWTVTADSLDIQDSLNLLYCSDARGHAPFFPVMGGKLFHTLQIPTTWPTTDEILGENGINSETVNEYYLSMLKPGLNIHTIHAEMEGKAIAPVFIDLLERLRGQDVRFITLAEAASEYAANAPSHKISMLEIAGRAGKVAMQGEEWREC
jgi:peptidoglycan/xylan/chitin deacetylase (PgdA/CDA1 family)